MDEPLNQSLDEGSTPAYTTVAGNQFDGEYDSLWEGDGNNLQMDNNELRISWNSGFFTRSRNVVSLSLDQINFIKMVQRSKPWILMVALLVGIFFPLYLNELYDAEDCETNLLHPCFLRSHEDDITGVCLALCIVLIIGYACTLKTTLVFGTSCNSSCCGLIPHGELYVHLLGREATENAERIVRRVHHQRTLFLNRSQ